MTKKEKIFNKRVWTCGTASIAHEDFDNRMKSSSFIQRQSNRRVKFGICSNTVNPTQDIQE